MLLSVLLTPRPAPAGQQVGSRWAANRAGAASVQMRADDGSYPRGHRAAFVLCSPDVIYRLGASALFPMLLSVRHHVLLLLPPPLPSLFCCGALWLLVTHIRSRAEIRVWDTARSQLTLVPILHPAAACSTLDRFPRESCRSSAADGLLPESTASKRALVRSAGYPWLQHGRLCFLFGLQLPTSRPRAPILAHGCLQQSRACGHEQLEGLLASGRHALVRVEQHCQPSVCFVDVVLACTN